MQNNFPYLSLFAYKSWSNRELFELLATIDNTSEQHAQVLHTSIRLLNHIYVVDQIFQAHLRGVASTFLATNTKETPSLAALYAGVRETDAWYEYYVSSISDRELQESVGFQFTDGDKASMRRDEILMHIITHGGYHRGNVGQLLKTINIAPPRDIYTRFLHESDPQRRQ